MRLRRYEDAAVAVRGLGPVLEAGAVSRWYASNKILLAMEEAGVPETRGRILQHWLGLHMDDPACKATIPAESKRATIHVTPDTLTEQVDSAEAALLAAGLGLYQQDGAIVRLGYVDGEGGREMLRAAPVDELHLAELMGRVIEWTTWDARAKREKATGCPVIVAKSYLARGPAEWQLPRLAGIIDMPTLRRDGSLLDAPGYDEATGLYYDSRDEEWPGMPEAPDEDDACIAAEHLGELLEGFPFVDGQDEAVALAAILTACIRRTLPAAPLHAFTAPAAGTGKSFLVDLVASIATGKPAPGLSWTGDPAEDRKALDAALLAGSPLISFDNVTAPLGGDRLNQALTQPTATIRVLGQSKLVEVLCKAVFLANGNNLAVAADMTRRTMLCRLDAGTERPELRTFRDNPLARVTADRGRYVARVLTILRAYHLAGRPGQPAPLGSFEAWSSWVRGAVIWLGYPDPAASAEAVRADDPARAALAAVLEQWNLALGDRPVSSADIIRAATERVEFREALLAVAGASGAVNTVRLGKWLGSIKGKLVGTLKIEPAGMSRGLARWCLRGGVPVAKGDVVPIQTTDIPA
jgi:hypothetical protein